MEVDGDDWSVCTCTVNVRDEKETLICDLSVVEGSGNARVTSSFVCVQEYGGGFVGPFSSMSRFSFRRGIGASSS